MKVLIVGAGVAGLALGSFLRDSDIEYDIVEKMPDWKAQGFLVAIWDSGRDILKKLGLADAFDTAGGKVDHYSIRNGEGAELRNIDLSHFYAAYGSAARVIARADVHAWLVERAGGQGRIRMGVSVRALSDEVDGVHVTFTTGEYKTYDVVVGADGVHSGVRALSFGHLIETYEDWRIWYTWIDNVFGTPATIVEYVEPGEFACVLGTGTRTSVWLVAPADHRVWDDAAGRIKRLERMFKDETVLVPAALQQLRDQDVQPSDLAHIRLQKWSVGRVVLIGEAAHCSGPHAGLGTTLALEDGYVLAGELMQVSERYPLREALATYEKKRRERIYFADHLNLRIKQGTLMRSNVLRKVANVFLPYVPRRFIFGDLERLLREEI